MCIGLLYKHRLSCVCECAFVHARVFVWANRSNWIGSFEYSYFILAVKIHVYWPWRIFANKKLVRWRINSRHDGEYTMKCCRCDTVKQLILRVITEYMYSLHIFTAVTLANYRVIDHMVTWCYKCKNITNIVARTENFYTRPVFLHSN